VKFGEGRKLPRRKKISQRIDECGITDKNKIPTQIGCFGPGPTISEAAKNGKAPAESGISPISKKGSEERLKVP